MESNEILRGPKKPKGHCDILGLHGTKGHVDTTGLRETKGTQNTSGWLALPGAALQFQLIFTSQEPLLLCP